MPPKRGPKRKREPISQSNDETTNQTTINNTNEPVTDNVIQLAHAVTSINCSVEPLSMHNIEHYASIVSNHISQPNDIITTEQSVDTIHPSIESANQSINTIDQPSSSVDESLKDNKPSIDEKSNDKSSMDVSNDQSNDEPSISEQIVDKSLTDDLSNNKPSDDEPSLNEISNDELSSEQPSSDQPSNVIENSITSSEQSNEATSQPSDAINQSAESKPSDTDVASDEALARLMQQDFDRDLAGIRSRLRSPAKPSVRLRSPAKPSVRLRSPAKPAVLPSVKQSDSVVPADTAEHMNDNDEDLPLVSKPGGKRGEKGGKRIGAGRKRVRGSSPGLVTRRSKQNNSSPTNSSPLTDDMLDESPPDESLVHSDKQLVEQSAEEPAPKRRSGRWKTSPTVESSNQSTERLTEPSTNQMPIQPTNQSDSLDHSVSTISAAAPRKGRPGRRPASQTVQSSDQSQDQPDQSVDQTADQITEVDAVPRKRRPGRTKAIQSSETPAQPFGQSVDQIADQDNDTSAPPASRGRPARRGRQPKPSSITQSVSNQSPTSDSTQPTIDAHTASDDHDTDMLVKSEIHSDKAQQVDESIKPARANNRGAKLSALATQRAEKEVEEAYKYQMVADPENNPLRLSHCASVYKLSASPCADIGSEKTPKYPCRGVNPQCLYHCGYTRRGIWQVTLPHLNLIGPSPSRFTRQKSTPTGLSNLGSTCYFNILLQQMYNLVDFRSAILRYESSDESVRQRWASLADSGANAIPSSFNDLADIPYLLASLFTQMACTQRSFVNPRFLVDALKLSHQEQQDAHEFRALFIQSLDSALKQSLSPSHHSLITQLFDGRSTSVLQCCECEQQRKQPNTFSDLVLMVKGQGSVHESLNSHLSHETLDKSNAVVCDNCGMKQPTIKYARLETLPPLLNVQLMRFELDISGNTIRKKKIAERIFVPDQIHFAGQKLPPSLVEEKAAEMAQEQASEPVPATGKGRRSRSKKNDIDTQEPPQPSRGRSKTSPSPEPVASPVPVQSSIEDHDPFDTLGLTPIDAPDLAVKSKIVNIHSFQLVAVLVHKGQFANHGHYTAMLRDEAGCWWNYDDRTVRRIGPDLWAKRESPAASTNAAAETVENDQAASSDTVDDTAQSNTSAHPPPKGRPGRKSVVPSLTEMEVEDTKQVSVANVPKKRGRKPAAVVEMEVEDVNRQADASDAPKKRGRKPAAVVEMEVDEINKQVDASDAPKKRGRKPAAAAASEPVSAGKPSKRKAAANAERAELEEARRKYGSGGFSKDAYMLVYADRSGKLVTTAAQPETEPDAARTKVVEWTEAMIARDNSDFEIEKSEFDRVHSELTSRIEDRKLAIQPVAACIQAQPIDLSMLRQLEANNQPFIEDPESCFIPTRWLTSFLVGWNDPEKSKPVSLEGVKAEGEEKNNSEKLDVDKDQQNGIPADKVAIDITDDDTLIKDEVDLTANDEKSDQVEDSEKPHEPDTAVWLTVNALRDASALAFKQLDPGPLDNAMNGIGCPHHQDCVDPRQVGAFKRISVQAWEQIVEWDHRMHPPVEVSDTMSSTNAPLTLKNLCNECTHDIYLGDTIRARSVESDRAALDHLLDLLRESRDKNAKKIELSHGFWVSREFVDEWKQLIRKRLAAARATKSLDELRAAQNKQRELDEQKLGSPTSDIRCQAHDMMLPVERDRVLVDEQIWNAFLAVSSGELKPLIQSEGAPAPVCPECEREHQQDEEELKTKRQRLSKEIASLIHWKKRCANFPSERTPPSSLVSGNAAIKIGYLLPGTFLKQLEEYHDEERDEKPLIDLTELLCSHGLFRYQPIPAPHEYHGIVGVKPNVLGFAEERDWASLIKTGHVSADVEPIKVTYTPSSIVKSLAADWDSYDITTTPVVCKECASAERSAEQTSKLMFDRSTGGYVTVLPVSTRTEAESEVAASLFDDVVSASGRRTRTKGRSIALRIPASCSDTIGELKMFILQQGDTECPVDQQLLYYHGRQLVDTMTLSEAGITQGACVKLFHSDEVSNVVVPNVVERTTKSERGFQGTALARHAHGLSS